MQFEPIFRIQPKQIQSLAVLFTNPIRFRWAAGNWLRSANSSLDSGVLAAAFFTPPPVF
jgi:hypothetical protein